MTAPFVVNLRTRPETVRVGAPSSASAPVWTLRVQVLEVWDTVRVEALPTTSVRDVKIAALAVLLPEAEYPDELVVKLNGFEILDESATLADVGALDGSIFLVGYRRRRPVR